MSPDAPGGTPSLPSPARTGRRLAGSALALALLTAAATCWWVLRIAGPALTAAREAEAAADTDFTGLRAELRGHTETLRGLQESLAASSARLAALEAEMATVAARLAMPPPVAGEPLLRFARAAHLIVLADEALRVMRDATTAERALRTAREELKGLMPTAAALDAALQAALAALEARPALPLAALEATWAAHADAVGQLPLSLPQAPQTEAPEPEVRGWRGLVGAVWRDLLSLVEVRKITPADAAFVDPALHALNVANLRLEITRLRWALVQGDPPALTASITRVRTALERDYASEAPEIRQWLEELSRLEKLDLAPALPNLAESLALLPAVRDALQAQAAVMPRSGDATTTDTLPPPADPRDVM